MLALELLSHIWVSSEMFHWQFFIALFRPCTTLCGTETQLVTVKVGRSRAQPDVSPGPGPVEGLFIRLRPDQLIPPTCSHTEGSIQTSSLPLCGISSRLPVTDNERTVWTHLWTGTAGSSSLPLECTCQRPTKPTPQSGAVTALPCSSFPRRDSVQFQSVQAIQCNSVQIKMEINSIQLH